MALPKSAIVPAQHMVFVLFRQFLAGRKHFDNMVKQFDFCIPV